MRSPRLLLGGAHLCPQLGLRNQTVLAIESDPLSASARSSVITPAVDDRPHRPVTHGVKGVRCKCGGPLEWNPLQRRYRCVWQREERGQPAPPASFVGHPPRPLVHPRIPADPTKQSHRMMLTGRCNCGVAGVENWNQNGRLVCPVANPRALYSHVPKLVCGRCGFVPEDPCQLDIDHINGRHADNRPENLQVLCANCHRLVSRKWGRGPHPRFSLSADSLAKLPPALREVLGDLTLGT